MKTTYFPSKILHITDPHFTKSTIVAIYLTEPDQDSRNFSPTFIIILTHFQWRWAMESRAPGGHVVANPFDIFIIIVSKYVWSQTVFDLRKQIVSESLRNLHKSNFYHNLRFVAITYGNMLNNNALQKLNYIKCFINRMEFIILNQ